jgi:hypothetical protein
MTKQEFDKLIQEQREKGMSDEDIAKVFAFMFKDGKLNREQIEGVLEAMGYEISEELKAMPDEEFKKEIITEEAKPEEGEEGQQGEGEGEKKPAEGGAEGGAPAPKAEKPAEGETEVEEETKKVEPDGEEEERKKAMKLFNLED